MPDVSKLKTGARAIEEAESFEMDAADSAASLLGSSDAPARPYEPERDLMARNQYGRLDRDP